MENPKNVLVKPKATTASLSARSDSTVSPGIERLESIPSSFFEKYKLREILNQNGDSSVASCVGNQSGKLYAVKIVPVISRPTHVSRDFWEVLEHRQNFHHSNLTRIFDVFRDGNYTWVVRDLVAQGDLQSLIQKKGTLNEATCLSYFVQLANGLKFLVSLQMWLVG